MFILNNTPEKVSIDNELIDIIRYDINRNIKTNIKNEEIGSWRDIRVEIHYHFLKKYFQNIDILCLLKDSKCIKTSKKRKKRLLEISNFFGYSLAELNKIKNTHNSKVKELSGKILEFRYEKFKITRYEIKYNTSDYITINILGNEIKQ